MLAYAIGIAPSKVNACAYAIKNLACNSCAKDTYWSTQYQPGNPYGSIRNEPYNRLQVMSIDVEPALDMAIRREFAIFLGHQCGFRLQSARSPRVQSPHPMPLACLMPP